MKTLQSLAKKSGLTIKKCGQSGHIQIIGGTCVVNYWPESKKRSAHIEGSTGGGRRGVTPEQAIEMAFSAPPEGVYRPRKVEVIGRDDDPHKRTPQQWAALNPILRYAFTKKEWAAGEEES
jgi:hypothetical protein